MAEPPKYHGDTFEQIPLQQYQLPRDPTTNTAPLPPRPKERQLDKVYRRWCCGSIWGLLTWVILAVLVITGTLLAIVEVENHTRIVSHQSSPLSSSSSYSSHTPELTTTTTLDSTVATITIPTTLVYSIITITQTVAAVDQTNSALSTQTTSTTTLTSITTYTPPTASTVTLTSISLSVSSLTSSTTLTSTSTQSGSTETVTSTSGSTLTSSISISITTTNTATSTATATTISITSFSPPPTVTSMVTESNANTIEILPSNTVEIISDTVPQDESSIPNSTTTTVKTIPLGASHRSTLHLTAYATSTCIFGSGGKLCASIVSTHTQPLNEIEMTSAATATGLTATESKLDERAYTTLFHPLTAVITSYTTVPYSFTTVTITPTAFPPGNGNTGTDSDGGQTTTKVVTETSVSVLTVTYQPEIQTETVVSVLKPEGLMEQRWNSNQRLSGGVNDRDRGRASAVGKRADQDW